MAKENTVMNNNNLTMANNVAQSLAGITQKGIEASRLLRDDNPAKVNNRHNAVSSLSSGNNHRAKLANNIAQSKGETSQALSHTTALHRQLHSVLSTFQGYGLTDLKDANLMSRVDSKFILPISLLPEILSQLGQHYRVLDIDGKRISTYFNQYFDTQDMRFYQDHHNGKLKRYKVRHRTYVDTDTEFLEVKCKNNQKRTIKKRIKLSANSLKNAASNAFIDEQMAEDFNQFIISQQGGYQRIALANEASAERLTLDFGLWFQTSQGYEKTTLPGFFIAELKQNKHCKQSPFYQLMIENQISPRSFSKYCIGCALLYKQHLKTNLFKDTLQRVNKFQQNFTTTPPVFS